MVQLQCTTHGTHGWLGTKRLVFGRHDFGGACTTASANILHPLFSTVGIGNLHKGQGVLISCWPANISPLFSTLVLMMMLYISSAQDMICVLILSFTYVICKPSRKAGQGACTLGGTNMLLLYSYMDMDLVHYHVWMS